ncbi:MAG: c-type cytochrome [Verrucomicrobiota bacterium]
MVFLSLWVVLNLPALAEEEKDERRFRTLHFWKNECASCHGQEGQGYDEGRGPAIAGLPDHYIMQQIRKYRDGFRGGTVPMDSDSVYFMHREAVELSDDLFRDLAGYVASLPPRRSVHSVSGDVERGGILYASLCSECHGSDAEGNAAKESPPLHGFQDWYIIEQVSRFRLGERKADPQNQDSVAMHAMAKRLWRPRDIRNIAAFITTRLDGEPDAQP